MNNELEKLQSGFKTYYSSEYATDEEDLLENTKLRKHAIYILTTALENGEIELAEQVLNTLSENTGCSEDLSIFEKLVKPLVATELITTSQVNMVVNAKGVARWK